MAVSDDAGATGRARETGSASSATPKHKAASPSGRRPSRIPPHGLRPSTRRRRQRSLVWAALAAPHPMGWAESPGALPVNRGGPVLPLRRVCSPHASGRTTSASLRSRQRRLSLSSGARLTQQAPTRGAAGADPRRFCIARLPARADGGHEPRGQSLAGTEQPSRLGSPVGPLAAKATAFPREFSGVQRGGAAGSARARECATGCPLAAPRSKTTQASSLLHVCVHSRLLTASLHEAHEAGGGQCGTQQHAHEYSWVWLQSIPCAF